MPWANLDDQFPEHPKNDGLSDAAFRLAVSGICYANRFLTDGFVASDRVPRIVPRFRKAALDELVSGGLWLTVAGGYEIHDFLDWNRSRAQVEEERERKRKAGKKGAEARWPQ